MRYKIGKIAEMAGVTVAAIRHYVKEGLLPAPVKTSANMAYYSEECVPLVQEIRRLQEEHFLPLPVIKKVLELREQGVHFNIEESTFAPVNIIRNFRGLNQEEFRKKFGLSLPRLKTYSKRGIFGPQKINGELVFGPDDLLMAELLREFEAAGFPEADVEIIAREVAQLSKKTFGLMGRAMAHSAPGERPGQTKKLYSLTSRFINLLYLNYSRENILRRIQTNLKNKNT